MRYVVIQNGVVTEVREGTVIPESPFVPYAGPVEVGWLSDGARFVAPDTVEAEKVLSNRDTMEAMVSGYLHRGIILSTSQTAQTRWTALYVARNSTVYPLTVWNADDTSSIEIQDADEVATIFIGIVTTLTTAHQIGAKNKIASDARQ